MIRAVPRRLHWRLTQTCLGLGVAFMASCERTPPALPDAPSTNGDAVTGTFEGQWNAAGSRRSLSLGSERHASSLELRGSLMLTGSGRPNLGFLAEAIALSDTETGLVGRGVWTDDQGDQVFSEIRSASSDRSRFVGTFIGGTGRYTAITGTYSFAWEFVIESDDGAIQGRAVGMTGHYSVPARNGRPRP